MTMTSRAGGTTCFINGDQGVFAAQAATPGITRVPGDRPHLSTLVAFGSRRERPVGEHYLDLLEALLALLDQGGVPAERADLGQRRFPDRPSRL